MKWIQGFLIAFVLMWTGWSVAHATINSPQAQVTVSANGATTAFNYGFIIPYQADGVTPAVTLQVQSALGVITDIPSNLFTITGVGNPSGGTVVYPLSGGPLASGNLVIITRNLAYTQPTAVSNQSFLPHTVEQIADKLDMQIQQLSLQVAGSGGSVSVNPLILSSAAGTWSISSDGSGNLVMARTAGSGTVNLGAGTPVNIPALPAGPSYPNDVAAAAAGVPVGRLYRNGSVTQVRVD